MDKYLVRQKNLKERIKPRRRFSWKRSLIEVNGKFELNYRHEMMNLLMRSYSEVGVFPHLYQMENGAFCHSNINRILSEASGERLPPLRRRKGVSSVDFDNKGIYLASVTKAGCLTVHDFEALYCQANKLTRLQEDESKLLLHLSPDQQLDVVKWNPLNQNEVLCASLKRNGLLIFDVEYMMSEPIEELRTRHTATVNGSNIPKGLTDVAFASNESRIFASDTHGTINVWDRRAKTLPCLELTSASFGTLNSIQLDAENQIIFGAGRHGIVYLWDIRGGRASTTFLSHKEICHPPVTSVKLATLLQKIGSLKAQAEIVPKEIHSIGLNPSCPDQLAFHLDDGWSGILDINNFQVTHIHCPPPAWLNDSYVSQDQMDLRKPSWLSTCSIYLAGSPFDHGLHMLDFYPSFSSPSHVDYKEDTQEFSRPAKQKNQNRFIHLPEEVLSCAAHPLYNAIVAGTKETSLLVISQKRKSCKGED
ncbi:Transducin/WD40 repeat superfamily protein [Trifolium repens]|nr:Transducin/WD40 repeat superfamily protein [Trifolium repens]